MIRRMATSNHKPYFIVTPCMDRAPWIVQATHTHLTCADSNHCCEYEKTVSSKIQLFRVLPVFHRINDNSFVPLTLSFDCLVYCLHFPILFLSHWTQRICCRIESIKKKNMLDCAVNGLCLCAIFFFLLSLTLFLNIQRSSSIKKTTTKDVINGFINITSQENLEATALK